MRGVMGEKMSKSNRDAAGMMGGNVLDMAMVREGVAKLSDNAGPTPTVTIGSHTYAPGDYPDHERITVTIDGSQFKRDAFGKRYADQTFKAQLKMDNRHTLKLAVMAGDTERIVEMGARAGVASLGFSGDVQIVWESNPIDDLRSAATTIANGATVAKTHWPTAQDFAREYPATFSDKPTGRWTAHHPDPATKARLEAELNATGGCFTAPKEPGAFSVAYTTPAHDPRLTVSLAPPESVDLSTLSNEDIDRLYGEGSWLAGNLKWAKAQPLGEVVMFDVTGERTSAERHGPAKPTIYEHAVTELAKRDLAVYASDAVFVAGEWSPRTWTFTAPPADLRSMHDAIGQAIETGTGRVESFNGGPVVVTRDEMRFSGAVVVSLNAITIAADTRALHRLRKACNEARETGRGTVAEWGKGASVEVVRRGDAPKVAEQAATEPVRYDGNQGGAQAWRWEVEGS